MSSEWEVLTLDQLIINHDTKRKPVKGPDRKPGPYPYYGASGIVDYVDGYIFDGDYLLIAEDGENLRTRQTPIAFMASGKFWVNNHAHIVTGNEKANTRYLQYALWATDISGYLTGAVMPKLTQGNMNKIELSCPSRQIQDEIVRVLGSLDDRITLLRETNATLEAIAQALFKSWFVDFDPVRAKAEGLEPEGMDAATAALFPDTFEESELGLVPKGWQIQSVGDSIVVTDYVANGSFAALKKNVSLQNTPSYALYLRTTDYNSGFSGYYRYVNKAAYDFLKKSSLDGSEVIISNVGDVGTVFRPPSWIGMPMTLGSNAVALKSPQMSCFLYFYFSGSKGQHDIQSIVTGSAQLKFNKTNFRSLRLVIPEHSILIQFEKIAGSLLAKIDNNLAQAQTLTQFRDAFLPRLISGQLRLPETEVSIENMLSEAV